MLRPRNGESHASVILPTLGRNMLRPYEDEGWAGLFSTSLNKSAKLSPQLKNPLHSVLN